MPEPIIPTRISPAGQPLPGPPAAPPKLPPPPPPPRPPGPPAPPPVVPPRWWATPPPPPPQPVLVHVDVYLPAPAEPEPGPPWWTRVRPVYNGLLIVLGLPLTGSWAAAIDQCRDEASLAGAWVLALVTLAIAAFADNVYRAVEAGANPNLWAPKVRAAVARTLLWSTVIAPALTLPVTTAVYILTGVHA